MTVTLNDRQSSVLKGWLDDYAEWLRATANCIPDYAAPSDLKDAEAWRKRAVRIRRFVSRHWKTEYAATAVRTR